MNSLDLNQIDLSILNFVAPPTSYPPSSYNISLNIESKFESQCLRFLKCEKKIYECSKKIERKLGDSINDSSSLDRRMQERGDKLKSLRRELNKINNHMSEAEKKESFLGEICKFINMEEAKKILIQPKVIDEDLFTHKIKEIDSLSQQVEGLNSDVKLISQIKQQLSSLLKQATNKLIKGNLSPKLIYKIINQFSGLFLRDPKVAEVFITSLISQRVNLFRIALNPLVNNINYAQNVADLYEKIISQWISLINEELSLFATKSSPPQAKQILQTVQTKLIEEVVPKMQRGIHKVKSLIDISNIRSNLMKLKMKIEQCGDSTWDPLPKVILKTFIIIEQKLESESHQFENAKFNIYSLVSYVPIREHLELIKSAKIFDPQNIQIRWERGFKLLSESKDPSKQPNNKSLIIFNINIWYLYQQVMKNQGELKQKCEQTLKECISSLVTFNISSLKKQNESKSLSKLFDMSSDLNAVKSTFNHKIENLFAEISLLGHEKLRKEVEKQIVQAFVKEVYVPILQHNSLEAGLKNCEVIQLAKKQKINLNKYGKQVENIAIYSEEEMRAVLLNMI